MSEEEKIEMVNLHNDERKISGADQFALVSQPLNFITYVT